MASTAGRRSLPFIEWECPHSVALMALIFAFLSVFALSKADMPYAASCEFSEVIKVSNLSSIPLLTYVHQWPNHGGGLSNRRFADHEQKISIKTAPLFEEKWRFLAGSDVSATPAIFDDALYFPTWDGRLYAVSVKGSLIWELNLTEAASSETLLISRTTPVITKELVLVAIYGPGEVIAFRREDGTLKWTSVLDDAPATVITMSGTAYDGAFYIGTSSLQEFVSCCNFQGSFQKLRLEDGRRIWRTFMLPDNNGELDGYSGAAVWGSSPAIDVERGLVYIATGNLYAVPPEVLDCLNANPDSSAQCIPFRGCNILYDSVVAMSIVDGRIKWCDQLGGPDVFTFSCETQNPPPAYCPDEIGPDNDFGEAPMLVTTPHKELVVVGQKSGIVYAFDRSTGQRIWETVAGPGGSLGGAIWGAATDNCRVYTNIANSDMRPFIMETSNQVTRAGGWVAMDAETGTILWSTANPTGAPAYGPVSVTEHGVLLVGSFDEEGHVFALNAYTGKIIWSGTTGATVYGGFSIGYGCGFIGSGYLSAPFGPAINATAGDSVFAFCVHHCPLPVP